MKQSHRNRTKHIFSLFCVVFLLSGCSGFNCTRFEDVLGSETDLIDFAYDIAESLTETSYPPLIPTHPDMPILVTTFVDNNDLEQTSKFGRILQEHINSRLAQLGYTVKEIKMAGHMLIEKQSGESILSRDLSKLSNSQNTQAVLAGTISYTNRTMYISARFINPVSRNIISSVDHRLCMDDNILAMFGLQKAGSSGSMIEEPSQPWLNKILY